MSDCAIQVDLSNRSFSLSGSAEFVDRYYQELVKLVGSSRVDSSQEGAGCENATNQGAEESPKRSADTVRYEKYGVFYFDSDTGLPVIQMAIPGDNLREQMRNVALILLLASDNTPLSASYIKSQCERQSCLDANNFSKAFGTDKRFIKKGKTGSREWTLELTIPGMQAARNLAEEMCQTI